MGVAHGPGTSRVQTNTSGGRQWGVVDWPACVSGFEHGDSTSLKWGSDGELTALDLHRILAPLRVHDPQVCGGMEDGGLPTA